MWYETTTVLFYHHGTYRKGYRVIGLAIWYVKLRVHRIFFFLFRRRRWFAQRR